MNKFYKLIVILILTYTQSVKAVSQETVSTVIDSDKLIVNYENNTAEFYGNVKIVKNDTTINCKKAIIYTAKDNKGENTQSQHIKKIELFEDIIIYQANKIAKGDIGEYSVKESMVTLLDNVSLKENGNYLEGDKLTYNLKTKTAKIISLKKGQNTQSKSAKERVRVFIPDN
ncbi:MAG: LptA/OstA family protein [Alphaproteobacteria bacterium]|jgi:lipopolysaccharide transport protein LptA